MNKKLIFIVLILPFIISAKIYKWTDENGKVHFTQTPGPKQEPTKIYRDTTRKKTLEKSLQGIWYGYSSRAKYKLKFSNDSFVWFLISGKYGSNIIAKGFYNKDDGKLIFTYTSQKFNSSLSRKKGGTIESYTIINFSLSKLVLRSEDNKSYRYRKVLTDSPQISQSHDLYGVWKNKKNGSILELLTAKFYLHAPGRYDKNYEYPAYTGQWILNDTNLEFRYLGDRQEIGKIGLSEKFTITYSNQHLTMENNKTREVNSYIKLFPDNRFKNKKFSF